MRWFVLSLALVSAAGTLSACAGGGSPADSARAGAPGIAPPLDDAFTSGLYVGQSGAVYGFPAMNEHNRGPKCTLSGLYPDDIAVDGNGNLIVPDIGGTGNILVFQGPQMCGTQVGSISDPYGYPADAASNDAINGNIVVANLFDANKKGHQRPGSVLVCTIAAGCTKNLTNHTVYKVGGVAMAPNGDCWASVWNKDVFPELLYFAGCSGRGKIAKGFVNRSYGSLDIDNNGNIVSIDVDGQSLYVYSGCNPACTLVGGPFALKNESFSGKLNQNNTEFAAGNVRDHEVDVYQYTPYALTFQYSFNKKISTFPGVAFNPRSKE
ncbi:MAG: hypothetical protein WB615_16405 [Candidatus Tumulicola sp.]